MVIKNPNNLTKLQNISQYNQMNLATFRKRILKEIDPKIKELLYSPCDFYISFEPYETGSGIYYRLCISRSKQVTTTPNKNFYDKIKKQQYFTEESNRESSKLKNLKYTDSTYVVHKSFYRNRMTSKQYKESPQMYSQRYESVLLDVYFDLFPLNSAMARRIGNSIK